MMTVAVVGSIGSGKGEVVKILKDKGYFVTSLSDRIREEALRRNLALTREVLQDLGDELRLGFGDAVLVRITADIIRDKGVNFVAIDSIRHPAEITYLRDEFNAIIIGVTASAKKRFELLRERGREGDPETFEEFLKMDKRELRNGEESHKIQVFGCLDMADVVIENEGSLEDFQRKIESTLISFGIERSRTGRERG